MSNIHGDSFDTDITILEEEWQEAELGEFEHYMLKEFMNNLTRLGNALTAD